MLILFIVFVVSLFFLLMGAEWFLKSAEKMGLALGLSPFIVGVTIVAFGTSFPELFAAMTAAFMNVTEIIPANTIGSNIANILLVVGLSAIIGKKLVVTKNLIDVDLPLLAIGTAILIGVIYPWGGEEQALITRPEAIILLLTYGAYLLYTIFHKDDNLAEKNDNSTVSQKEKPRILAMDWLFFFGGMIALTVSAKYLIESIIGIAEFFDISVGVISLIAVAIGTSLPELIVSIKAAFQKKSEIALGNIFGSNLFNSFVVLGLPGIFREIHFDEPTFLIGFPVMIIATLLFVVSGISKCIHNWEGFFYLSLYAIFLGKILSLF